MKKTIKNLTVAMVFGATVLGSQSVFAGAVGGDLYLGFQNQAGAGKSDYIINLGPASGIIGGSTVVNLSSDISFANFTSTGANGLQGTNAVHIQGGVVGGQGGGTAQCYVTQFRNGAGVPSIPGSIQPPSQTKSEDVPAFNDLNSLVAPAAGTGVLDTSLSWENDVEPTFNAGSFWGETGNNPDSSITTNSTVYEDLWFTSSSGSLQPFVYEGYFTFTITTTTASLTFTPLNAPAPLTPPAIQSVTWSNNVAQVIWSTVATHTYQLQGETDLSSSNWVNVGTSHVANNSFMTNSDSSASASYKFYRVTGQ